MADGPPAASLTPAPHADVGLVLSGGGARAAYQVGFLSYLASAFPEFAPGVLTGVSAGAVNAAYLASHAGRFSDKVRRLATLWSELRTDEVFRVDARDLVFRVMRWGMRLVSGGRPTAPSVRSLVETAPLRDTLERVLDHQGGILTGIEGNLAAGALRAVALTGSSYTTGQSITWVQGGAIPTWERPQRKGVNCRLTVSHVMASSALPFFFPAVEVDGAWYGDGGIRLTAPLSPAVHLGATRIIAVSTRYARSREEADRPAVTGYPPPAQVMGVLFNAIFLDLLDGDALRLQQINEVLDQLPPARREGMRHIDLLALRPSQDLGQLANEFEPELPTTFRFLTRGLGTRETRSNDMLSLLMFQPDYIDRLLEMGEADARARHDEIGRFLQAASAAT